VRFFRTCFPARRRAIRGAATGIATIESSNELFNEVCRRSTADLYMLMTQTRHGIYPYAGIPWYSTAFGRDGSSRPCCFCGLIVRRQRGS